MKIKWESNSRVKFLEAQGKIKSSDIIPRTRTYDFPAGVVTVRMARMKDKVPAVTLHIRGKSRLRTYSWNKDTYECASTCRVNFGGSWQGKLNTAMDSNGELDENLTWLDVHNAVEEVKEVMDIK